MSELWPATFIVLGFLAYRAFSQWLDVKSKPQGPAFDLERIENLEKTVRELKTKINAVTLKFGLQ